MRLRRSRTLPGPAGSTLLAQASLGMTVKVHKEVPAATPQPAMARWGQVQLGVRDG